MTIILRNATPKDETGVREVFMRSWLTLAEELSFQMPGNSTPLLRIPATRVATIEGKLVGFIGLSKDNALLERIYVHPKFQNAGIGKTLLHEAKELGARRLWVDEGNKRGRLFYHKNGWEPNGLRGPGIIFPNDMLQYELKVA